MEQKPNADNQYMITEQGDLGLGAQQLTNEEQAHLNAQKAAQSQQQK